MGRAWKSFLIVTAFITVSFFSCLAIGSQSQQQQTTPKETARAAEVLVDATVVDKRNRVVRDLTAADFVVYEDGVPQDIANFEFRHGETESKASATAPGASRPNIIMMLLDYSTTEFQNQKLVRDATVKFIQEKLQPRDVMAVFSLSAGFRALTPFTYDKTTLVAALGLKDVTGTAQAGARAATSSEVAAGAAAGASQASAGGVSVSGINAAAIAQQATEGASAQGDASASLRMAGQLGALRSAIDRRTARGILDAIQRIAVGVRQAEGRKSLILFSQGFVVDPRVEEEMKSIVAAANAANLVIYCVNTRGLFNLEQGDQTGNTREDLSVAIRAGAAQRDRMLASGGETVFDNAVVSGNDADESTLRFIASQTGGDFFKNTNDLGTALSRIEEEIHDYYLLSYRPKSPLDGKFHSIRVEVRKPGLTVRSRNGYSAVPADLEGLPAASAQMLLQARAAGQPSQPLFLKAAGFRASGGLYRVPVILEAPAAGVRFDKNGDKYSARVEFVGVVRDASDPNAVVAGFGRPFQLNLTEAEYKVLKPGTFSVVETVRLPAGTYAIEVAGKDLSSGEFLHTRQGIYLREPENKLALSTILLSNQVQKAASKESVPADGFLSTQGANIMPSARCHFRNGDHLVFYFDVYNARVDPAKGQTDVSVTLALLKDGKRIKAQLPQYKLTEVPAGDPSRLTVARYLQLAGLPAGDYSLIVEVKDTLNNEVERAQAPFTIVN